MRYRIKFIWLAMLLAASGLTRSEADSVCARAVQDQVDWNYSGNSHWQPANIARLCAGAETNTQPARCFETAMHGGVENGRGTHWRWQEALELCAGSHDHVATLNCFRERIASGMQSDQARRLCRWKGVPLAKIPGSTPASTQSIEVPRIRSLPRGRTIDLANTPTWSEARTSVSHATGTVRSSISQPLGEVAALNSFELRFHSSDHKINRIAVIADDRFANLAFNDSDGEDQFEASAQWIKLTGAREGEISATATGRVDLPIEAGPPGTKLALGGFAFTRAPGTDANVRMIGIRLDPVDLVARVWLIDDQGIDLRGAEEVVGWSALGGLILPPLGHIVGGAVSMPAASPGGRRAYQVTVQYTWIPDELIISENSKSGTTAFNLDGWRPPGTIALQGFEFTFGNSDHHLGGFGVTLGAEHHNVLYRDQDWDDPIQWAVSYAVLNPGRRAAAEPFINP